MKLGTETWDSSRVCVHACAHTHVPVHGLLDVYLCICTCVFVWRRPEVNPGCHSFYMNSTSPFIIKGLSLNLQCILASEPKVATHFHFLSSGTINVSIPRTFLWMLGVKLRSSFFHGKDFTNWAISQPQCFNSVSVQKQRNVLCGLQEQWRLFQERTTVWPAQRLAFATEGYSCSLVIWLFCRRAELSGWVRMSIMLETKWDQGFKRR